MSLRGKEAEFASPVLFAGAGVEADLPGEPTEGVKVATRTLFLGVPLRTKGGKEVMTQVQSVVNRLEAFGFPVHRYFSDRAKELRSHALIQWLRDRGVHPAFTAGEDPAGNKSEIGVKHLKQDARKLLRAAGLSSEFWPLAVNAFVTTQFPDVVL